MQHRHMEIQLTRELKKPVEDMKICHEARVRYHPHSTTLPVVFLMLKKKNSYKGDGVVDCDISSYHKLNFMFLFFLFFSFLFLFNL